MNQLLQLLQSIVQAVGNNSQDAVFQIQTASNLTTTIILAMTGLTGAGLLVTLIAVFHAIRSNTALVAQFGTMLRAAPAPVQQVVKQIDQVADQATGLLDDVEKAANSATLTNNTTLKLSTGTIPPDAPTAPVVEVAVDPPTPEPVVEPPVPVGPKPTVITVPERDGPIQVALINGVTFVPQVVS